MGKKHLHRILPLLEKIPFSQLNKMRMASIVWELSFVHFSEFQC